MMRSARTIEALRLLHRDGPLLQVAREVSRILREAGIDGAVIGGVATVLHGHVRTTLDIDVFVPPPAKTVGDVLLKNGFQFDASKKEFVRDGVPVHLVLEPQTGYVPTGRAEIDGITTVDLPDLINLKLRSGTRSVTRAQDIADVIGLIRVRQLTSKFASQIEKDLRPEFRKLAAAIASESAE
jgi:hypothetical protein